jgi:F-type H+-transporting ATPase subunit b
MKLRIFVLGLVTAALCLAAEQGGAAEAEPEPVWVWANFLILAIGLGYLLAKHLPTFFQTRTESIRKDIVEAQQAKTDAERRAADMEARMNAIGAEIEKFRAEARAEMEQEGARIRRETADLIEKMERQAQLEIESAGTAARRQLRAYAAELAVDLAEQRIRERLDEPTEASLIEGFVRNLQREESRN